MSRRRRRVIETILSALVLISGTAYTMKRWSYTNKIDLPELTAQERSTILEVAIALKQQHIDWGSIHNEDTQHSATSSSSSPQPQRRQLQSEGVPIADYEYNRGSCPDEGSEGVPCSPDTLARNCNKRTGRLSQCLLDCAPSYCCIHDTPAETNPFAPSCRMDENCAQYAPCNIAWWKLQDMVGPATELQLQQSDDFFDVDILQDVIMDPIFFQQLLFHHFDDIQPILELLGMTDSIQEVFALPEIWDANSAISGKPAGDR